MLNYVVEENINFFDELYKSLDENEENGENNNKKDESLNNETELCLITQQPLENHFVKMNCGHKFNYLPLYKYLINYKQKFNSMESTKQKLDINEIRCPYCRLKQSDLLPYYDDIKGIRKINGINNVYLKPDYNYNIPCCFKIDYNTTYSYQKACGRFYTCQLPEKYKEKEKEEGYYCSFHLRKVMVLMDKKEKDELKQQKILEKQKLKEEKMKAKQELMKLKLLNHNKIKNENVILNQSSIQYCQSILKYGANKGNQCSLKALDNGYCKRHSNIQGKKEETELIEK